MNWFTSRRRLKLVLTYLSGLLLLGALLAVAGWLLFGPLLRIRQIFCQVATDPCPAPVWTELNQLENRPLVLLNINTLKTKLASLYPTASTVAVTRLLPRALRIEISLRFPAAQIKSAPASADVIVVDDQGITLTSSPSADLPLLITHLPRSPLTLAAIKLARLLQDSYLPFAYLSVNTDQSFIEAYLPSGQRIRFSSQKDLSTQVRSLQLILRQATINPSLPIIDLRFDRPILTTE